MAHLILLRNPLTPQDKEEHELLPGETPIEWLQKHHPDGFGMPIRFYVNADEKPLDDLDYMPDIDDIVIIALMPGGFLAAMPLLVKVVIGLAVMAAAYFAMMLFAPKQPKKQKQPGELESYNISSEQTAAKVGEPIPVVYGDVWMAPEYAAQPYSWYSWNEGGWNEWFSGVQYLDLLMCVGQGVVDVKQVRVGSSDADSLGQEVVLWKAFTVADHNAQLGYINTYMGGSFYENVVTCPEVGNQEFQTRGNSTPFYTICKAGTQGRWFQIDIIFPNGLFYNGGSKGKMIGAMSDFTVFWQEVDANGVLHGPIYSQLQGVDAAPNAMGSGEGRPEICNPFRRTFTFDTGRYARWAVKIVRNAINFPADEGQSTFVWSGLKLIADQGQKAYGDVTLLAVRVKASRGVGADAAVRITARCQRNLYALPNHDWQFSRNPADAFYDIYNNSVYGAGIANTAMDLPVMRKLRMAWGGYTFDYVFRESTTIWEALKLALVGHAAEPLPQGSFMSIAQDGVKPNRSMLFTDANIVEGTMKVNYIFDVDQSSDGIEVSYVDPYDWHEVFVRYPANSVAPETVLLPGCTSTKHAQEYARLVWQRNRSQRKRITFDTELEGIILQLGDRIAISHDVPKWGDNGLVIGIRGTEIIVDHDLDWSGGGKYMMFRKADGSPSDMFSVTQGSQPNVAILGTPLNFAAHVDDDYDYTSFAFGTATTMIRDFTVASTKHTGDTTVTVEAVNYAPEIFDGTMPFLGGKP